MTERQLYAAVLAGMTVPLTLTAARLHWRWVFLALVAAAIYYYIMYKCRSEKPLAAQAVSLFGIGGKAMLWLTALWLILLSGVLTRQSTLTFPQTAKQPLTGLLLLTLAAAAAKLGIRAIVRCTAVLLLVLAVLYGTVLVFSAPQVKPANLRPTGDVMQAVSFFSILTLPTLALYFHPQRDGTKPTPALIAGAILTLGAAAVTAGCLSPQLAVGETSFYELSRSVSLFGTVRRFEALISSACLISYFCALSFVLCTVREILSALLPRLDSDKIFLLPFAAVSAALPKSEMRVVTVVGAAIFCAVFPLITQGIGARKKV